MPKIPERVAGVVLTALAGDWLTWLLDWIPGRRRPEPMPLDPPPEPPRPAALGEPPPGYGRGMGSSSGRAGRMAGPPPGVSDG